MSLELIDPFSLRSHWGFFFGGGDGVKEYKIRKFKSILSFSILLQKSSLYLAGAWLYFRVSIFCIVTLTTVLIKRDVSCLVTISPILFHLGKAHSKTCENIRMEVNVD